MSCLIPARLSAGVARPIIAHSSNIARPNVAAVPVITVHLASPPPHPICRAVLLVSQSVGVSTDITQACCVVQYTESVQYGNGTFAGCLPYNAWCITAVTALTCAGPSITDEQ
eukprot:983676-Rhodomonas_salina.1